MWSRRRDARSSGGQRRAIARYEYPATLCRTAARDNRVQPDENRDVRAPDAPRAVLRPGCVTVEDRRIVRGRDRAALARVPRPSGCGRGQRRDERQRLEDQLRTRSASGGGDRRRRRRNDFNKSLTVIMGAAVQLHRRATPAGVRRAATRTVDRATELTRQLLAFHRRQAVPDPGPGGRAARHDPVLRRSSAESSLRQGARRAAAGRATRPLSQIIVNLAVKRGRDADRAGAHSWSSRAPSWTRRFARVAAPVADHAAGRCATAASAWTSRSHEGFDFFNHQRPGPGRASGRHRYGIVRRTGFITVEPVNGVRLRRVSAAPSRCG